MAPPSLAAALRRLGPRAPLAPPEDLTVPAEGSSTVRDHLGRYLVALLRELAALPSARLAPARALELDRVRAVLADRLAAAPGPVLSLLRSPAVSVLVRCASIDASQGDLAALDRNVGALVERVLFELAAAGALPGDGVALARPVAHLASIGHDLSLRFEPAAEGVRFLPGRLEVALPAGPRVIELGIDLGSAEASEAGGLTVAHPFPRIRGGIALALEDDNPLASFEAHPDKDGNRLDLGGQPASAWIDVLGGCIDLVETYLPDIAREMHLLLQQIVPVGWHAERHLSASYAESVGTIYMTLHPSFMTMAEALVHEFQHNKLNALFALDGLLDNAFQPLFTSPVRPDPRPLHGVLLAVHAFQPIALLYERMIAAGDPRVASPDALRRFDAVKSINREGSEVLLPNARPTPVGHALLQELARWHRHFGGADAKDPGASLSPA